MGGSRLLATSASSMRNKPEKLANSNPSSATSSGSSASGASDTFVGSAGNTTVVASSGANNGGSNPTNLFEFIHDSAGGTELVQGLTSIGQVDLHLSGYASNDTGSVASQNNTGGNLNVTLTDGTQITFQNITSPLTNSNFS